VWIYLVRNKLNGRLYVGKPTTGVRGRWAEHQRLARLGVQTPLYAAIRKYGPDNFDVFELDRALSVEGLNRLERLYIQRMATLTRFGGYNCTEGGDGVTQTPEIRQRISASMKGNQNLLGHKHTTESRKKMKEAAAAEGHEVRSQRVLKGRARLTKQMRREIALQGWRTRRETPIN
jgi:group I intron endonuclease